MTSKNRNPPSAGSDLRKSVDRSQSTENRDPENLQILRETKILWLLIILGIRPRLSD